MSLNESILEEAALILPAATLTPPLSQGERESYSEVVQSRVARTLIPAFSQREKEKREAIRRLNPVIPEEIVYHPKNQVA